MKPLVKKLKQLQSVAPSNDWKRANRGTLLSEITKQANATATTPAVLGVADGIFATVKSSLSFMLPEQRTLQLLKPAGALFSISLFVLSTGIFSVSASQSTVPGDTLYRLKLATERVQKALTTTEPEKAKLEIAFAGKRIEELEKIVSDSAAPAEETDKKVTAVITNFQKNISSAKETLDVLKETESHAETVALAEVIDAKVGIYKETLQEVVKEVPKEVKEAVTSAANDAAEKGDAALSVIAEKHEDGSVTTNEEGVAEKVDLRLVEIQKLIKEINSDIAYLQRATSTSKILATSTVAVTGATASTTKEILTAQFSFVTMATKQLDGVAELITNKKFTEALTQIKDIRGLLKSVRAVLDPLLETVPEKPVDEPKVIVPLPPVTTTTTPVIDTAPVEEVESESVGEAPSGEESATVSSVVAENQNTTVSVERSVTE